MRTLSQRARGAMLALGALLIIAIPFAVSPAAAKTEAQGTKTTTPTAGIATAALTVRTAAHARRRRAAAPSCAASCARAAPATSCRCSARAVGLEDDRPRPHRRARGAYRMASAPRKPGSAPAARPLRRRRAGDAGAPGALGRLNVYRRAFASWYGPGLYGNKLGCGGTLTRRHDRRRAQDAAVRHEADAALPRPHRARARHRPRAVRRRSRVRPHRRHEAAAGLRLDRLRAHTR